MKLTIPELQKSAHDNAVGKGFHEQPVGIGLSLALIHSEVSEALEADRVNNWCKDADLVNEIMNNDDEEFKLHFIASVKDSFEDELADVVIRVFDLCGKHNIDLNAHINAKMRFNSLRPRKHGKEY